MLLDMVPVLSILILNRSNFRDITRDMENSSKSNKTSFKSQSSDDLIRVRFLYNLELITQQSDSMLIYS